MIAHPMSHVPKPGTIFVNVQFSGDGVASARAYSCVVDDVRAHWDQVWSTKADADLSWHRGLAPN